MLIIAAAEASRGWGGPVALALAIIAFAIVAGVTERLRTHPENPSPTEGAAPSVRVNPQFAKVSDTDDTDDDTGGWWGRIATVGGRRVRVVDDVDDLDDVDEPQTIEDAVAELLDDGVAYSRIVDTLVTDWHVSEATAKRRIRDVRAERIAAAS
ncbi:hypothetical protein [Micromonospora sp. RTGN7]|uniref:hypothetical protein n=1 Tax=Micromonospora sp. RTGN7 TaxID=3016526 RepID=UPI0029FEE888|nr:hypothetical protein [Micromonospora sp. RTGN7]